MDVHTVILNWNAADDTAACAERLAHWRRVVPRVRIVDNGSSPDPTAALAERCPHAIVMRSDRNLGFAGGTNLGLKAVLEEEPAPILLLNNDVTLGEDAVESLLETLRSRPRCGAVGPVLVSPEGPGRVISAGSRGPLLRRQPALRGAPDRRRHRAVDFVSGAAVVLRFETVAAIGLLDEDYFFSWELADFCRRARIAGFECLVDAEARAEHDLERSSALRDTLYVYYSVRNRLLYARRALPLTWPLPVLLWACYGLQQSWRLRRRGRQRTATAIRMGVRDGLQGRFGDRNDALSRALDAGGVPAAEGSP